MISRLLFGACLVFSLNALGQQPKFSIEFQNESLESVLELVTRSTGYFFAYNSAIIDSSSRFSLKMQDVTLDEFLNRLLVGTGLEHQVLSDQVIIRQAPIDPAPINKVTFSISGRVLDSLNNLPISGANVFLSGTNIGSVTDLEGYYMIEDIPIGSYEVIFSHLSFNMVTADISGKTKGMQTANMKLSQRTKVLDTIHVVSRRLIGPDERKRFVRVFEREFLGRSTVAKKCVLLNPEVLDFIYDRPNDRLEVFALEPVKVENRLLGYQITYFFEKFTKTGDVLDFYGRARFENLRPSDKRQKRIWLRNRKRVYFGSFLHFRRSLVSNTLRKNDFRIALVKADFLREIQNANAEKIRSRDIVRESGDFHLLNFDGFLEVIYRRKTDEEYIRQFYESPDTDYQQSLLRLQKGSVKIKSNGGMEYPGIETYGYWYWERIGDLLPENYDPDFDEIEL